MYTYLRSGTPLGPIHVRTVMTRGILNQTLTSPGGQNESQLRQTMQKTLDEFMSDQRHPQ